VEAISRDTSGRIGTPEPVTSPLTEDSNQRLSASNHSSRHEGGGCGFLILTC
jgi:hypothetical protein